MYEDKTKDDITNQIYTYNVQIPAALKKHLEKTETQTDLVYIKTMLSPICRQQVTV